MEQHSVKHKLNNNVLKLKASVGVVQTVEATSDKRQPGADNVVQFTITADDNLNSDSCSSTDCMQPGDNGQSVVQPVVTSPYKHAVDSGQSAVKQSANSAYKHSVRNSVVKQCKRMRDSDEKTDSDGDTADKKRRPTPPNQPTQQAVIRTTPFSVSDILDPRKFVGCRPSSDTVGWRRWSADQPTINKPTDDVDSAEKGNI